MGHCREYRTSFKLVGEPAWKANERAACKKPTIGVFGCCAHVAAALLSRAINSCRRIRYPAAGSTAYRGRDCIYGPETDLFAAREAAPGRRLGLTQLGRRLCIAAVTKMLVRGVRSNPTATMSGTASDSHDSEAAHFRSVVPPQSAGTAHAHPRSVLLRASIVAMVVPADEGRFRDLI